MLICKQITVFVGFWFLFCLSLSVLHDKVKPYIDISAIYNHLLTKQPGQRIPKQTKSLATIYEELVGISLSKVFFFFLSSLE